MRREHASLAGANADDAAKAGEGGRGRCVRDAAEPDGGAHAADRSLLPFDLRYGGLVHLVEVLIVDVVLGLTGDHARE